jgi:hypothetical protein
VLIAAGVSLGLLVVFVLWRRLSEVTALVALGVLGMVVGSGALLLQSDPGPADWVAALGLLAVLTPAHCRFAFGPPGRRAEAPVVAAGGNHA